ncbi:YtoQ family protein [Vibrio gallicus]|uniref:YtoQ family protein n=1 Tax=Vibrio gallicus TaxID=190897 RepID=UPI0021C3779F|nr:YtoQ family protein [Vibrio gallicus]
MKLKIYLSGEIHSDWREQIVKGCEEKNINACFTSAVTDHEKSDAAGDCLGSEQQQYWRDHKSAKVNSIRIQTAIKACDLAIIRFGDKYKQWNAAFDAGFCAALGKPYITLHDENLVHALKEVDASAQAWATTPQQIVELIAYTISGE